MIWQTDINSQICIEVSIILFSYFFCTFQFQGLPLPQDGYVPLKKPLSLHESPPPITPETQSEHVSSAETKALRNWKVRMAQRSMQQNYICSKYLMNTSRAFSDVSRWAIIFHYFHFY